MFAALTLKTASTKKACAPRPGADMPAYAPTAKEREIVEEAAGFGLPHDKICQLIVSERTGKPIGLYIGRRQGQRGEEYRQGTGGRSGLGRGVSDSALLVAFVLAVLGAVLLIAAASW